MSGHVFSKINAKHGEACCKTWIKKKAIHVVIAKSVN